VPVDKPENWPDYLALGITQEHIPELARMATDITLYNEDAEDPASWAPIHAWRALGQLQTTEALEPLVEMMRQKGEGFGWGSLLAGELPNVLALIGPASLPVLQAYLAETAEVQTEKLLSLLIVIDALERMVERHPETRDQCIAMVTQQLEAFEQNDPEWNAWLICMLVDWKAMESIDLIEQAFQSDCVEEMVAGDWDDVQVSLGLKSPTEVPPKRLFDLPTPTARALPQRSSSSDDFFGHGGSRKTKARAKRKQQADSRKKNRPKKKKKK
jgi:hypothetical protein